MKKLLFPFLTFSILFVVHWSLPAQQQPDYQVIVHPDNPTASLTRTEVSKILLKKKKRWDDGSPAEPVDLPANSPTRKAFSKDVHGRSASGIQSYWQRQIFSGSGVPPREVATDADVVDFVKSNRGAIGYVSGDAPVDGVKVLTVTE